ncbi:MAG TPA: translation factor GTPase family protein [Nocardioides sp.]|uniref:translation factor GTPase family protein n=1 Tax=Nocardioides sp. TaxID=35761 RepID=UPI002E31CB76|nr:translation factor GTPase family protein [Nocardioides sp.]HEX5086209.1 translation factor GTPase family protein [Nocardioides sp.]
MLRRTLNLGILAHVDAGKTTLTERLLHAAGVIDHVGSVDAGTTQTDSLALERERGITIRSTVAAFERGDTTVNLIDTPGHPDFIAEVERVLSVLDGAVLVLSAVEGVQPQTTVLMRALRRLDVPTVLFINKTDRAGADVGRVLAAVRERLTPYAVDVAGDDLLDLLTERDDRLLAAYLRDEAAVDRARLRRSLARQTRRSRVFPVFSGSASRGDGVEPLMDALVELLAPPPTDDDGALAARVFKIERGAAGEKVAYLRLFRGRLGLRDRISFGGVPLPEKVVEVAGYRAGQWVRTDSVGAGEIARVRGPARVRVGDGVGTGADGDEHHFPPPTLEAVVAARDPALGHRLRAALVQLADQDPLIGVRHDDLGRLSVSLYGRVQQEVIAETLARDHGVEVDFEDATVVHVERPRRVGEALELLNTDTNPYHATVGLRIDPGTPGSGLRFCTDVPAEDVPLYLFKSHEGFRESIERHVRDALAAGLHGWQVTDCLVTLTRIGYSSWDGPPSTRGPLSVAVDYRKLTPIVARQALRNAGTMVCEPLVDVRVEAPTATAGALQRELGRLGASTTGAWATESFTTFEVVLAAARFHDLQRQLPDLTGGEGVAEPRFAGYQPVRGRQPSRTP